MFIYFSLLMACSNRVLHLAIIALFPFRFTRGIPSDLLVLCSIIHILLPLSWTTDYVIVMHTLSLSHHTTESSSVREHFVSIGSSKVLATNHCVFIFVTSSKLLVLLSITLLTFNINGRLRSDSVFGWSWTRFLWVWSTLFSHTLTADRMIILAIRDSIAHQIVMLLHETKWIWRGPVVMMHTIISFRKTLGIWTSWSFLCSSGS